MMFKSFKNFIKDLIRDSLDIIYPRYCYICKKNISFTDNYFVCYKCLRYLPLIKKSFCRKCGNPQAYLVKKCIFCKGKKFKFNEIRVGGLYKDGLKDLIIQFKFKNSPELKYILSRLIEMQIKKFPFRYNIDFITSVPMYYKKELKRGYNQSEILAKVLAKRLKIKYIPLLKKVKSTSPQIGLTKEERKRNLKGSIEINNEIRDITKLLESKIVLIVDDIITTGSTLNECSFILKKVGVKIVYGGLIAKAI